MLSLDTNILLYAQNRDCAEHAAALDAAAVCASWRDNHRWALIENAPVMDKVWDVARRTNIARRAVFDARIALTLRHLGVIDFATRNTADFEGFGFTRLNDPLDADSLQVHEAS